MKRMRKLSKRGDGSAVFVYVLTMVIVVMVLIFGYKAIEKVGKTSQSAANAQFLSKMRNAIDAGSSYGKISTESFETPQGSLTICFVTEGAASNDLFGTAYPAGVDVATSNDNVFLYDGKNIKETFKVDPFEVTASTDDPVWMNPYGDDALCIPIKDGKFLMRMEGLGDRTKISI